MYVSYEQIKTDRGLANRFSNEADEMEKKLLSIEALDREIIIGETPVKVKGYQKNKVGVIKIVRGAWARPNQWAFGIEFFNLKKDGTVSLTKNLDATMMLSNGRFRDDPKEYIKNIFDTLEIVEG